jgi:hypothetical protein
MVEKIVLASRTIGIWLKTEPMKGLTIDYLMTKITKQENFHLKWNDPTLNHIQ